MTRLLKLVERVEEDLDIFLNDKSMTNEQAFKEMNIATTERKEMLCKYQKKNYKVVLYLWQKH